MKELEKERMELEKNVFRNKIYIAPERERERERVVMISARRVQLNISKGGGGGGDGGDKNLHPTK